MTGRLVGYAVGRYRGPQIQPYLEDEVYLTREDADDDAGIMHGRDPNLEYRVYEVREVTE
ncbi:hypothetical protein ACWCW7_34405 [Nocardia tengchongensis]